MSDMDLVIAQCLARYGRQEISDACARLIASLYHDGQTSASYTFASTGAIVTDSSSDLWRELFPDYQGMSPNERAVADMMGTYLLDRCLNDMVGSVEGWSSLWLTPGEV